MCRNMKEGGGLKVIREVGEGEEGEEEDGHYHGLGDLNDVELEEMLRKCEQPRGSIVDKPASISEASRSSSARLNELQHQIISTQ